MNGRRRFKEGRKHAMVRWVRCIVIAVVVVFVMFISVYVIFPVLLHYLMQALLETLR
ncbi:MAG: hypothetical protein ACFFCW_36545 [Candidatus Hodarchaeota archaeon]